MPELGARPVAPTWIPAPADMAPATLDSLASRVLDEATRAGLDRFHLVGHSMGGQIAQLVGDQAPDRGRSLAIVNAVPLSGLPLPSDVAAASRASGGNRAA